MRPEVWLDVVGIGEDGFAGLGAAARGALEGAERIYGATRHLASLPPAIAARATAWPSPMMPFVEELLVVGRGRPTAILATGDPLFYGIGATIARRVPSAETRYHPQLSSFALACARLGWAEEDVTLVSAVARPLDRVRGALGPGRRLVVFSENGATPAALARLLVDAGYGKSVLTVLEAVGGAGERRVTAAANDVSWLRERVADLNLACVSLACDEGLVPLALVPGLPDDAFDHDGQLTKRDVRAQTLGRLAPRAGDLLWDVGAGAGSVAIEWMRAHPACRAIAFERDVARGERLLANARRLGVPELRLVAGEAPAALHGAPPPDAVFIGGGVATPDLIETCLAALKPGGRLVANSVTLGGEAALLAAYDARGGDLTRLAFDHASPVGRLVAWRPAMPIVQWTLRA